MQEYIDENRCTECGGVCCHIYEFGRQGDMWFEEYVNVWDKEFAVLKDKNIPPIHNPWRSHVNTSEGEAIRSVLKRYGYNVDACQYLIPGKGCRIPREYRPQVCREYKCW